MLLLLLLLLLKGYKLGFSILGGFAFVHVHTCCEVGNQIWVIMLEVHLWLFAFASAVFQR